MPPKQPYTQAQAQADIGPGYRPNGQIDETAQLRAQLQAMMEENARLKATQSKPRAITWKVSEKGAISIYGLGRFPFTFYKSQWDKLYPVVNEIEEFRQANDASLTSKE